MGFQKNFRKHGVEPLSTFLKVYKKGDIVDIKGNGAFQKGMPHKFYHGKTGRVFNVTQHAVGIIVNKQLRGKILPKRINVRIEHINRSRRKLRRRVSPLLLSASPSSPGLLTTFLPKTMSPSSWPPFLMSLSHKLLLKINLNKVKNRK